MILSTWPPIYDPNDPLYEGSVPQRETQFFNAHVKGIYYTLETPTSFRYRRAWEQKKETVGIDAINTGERWHKWNDERLGQRFYDGATIEELAAQFGRKSRAIAIRLRKLGILA